MKKEMLINVLQPEECRIAILEDGVLEELYVERTSHESYVGNIYKGRIVNIEPSIQAAFVDFGVGRNGFLHVSDVEPAYYRFLEQRRGDNDNRRHRGRDRHRGGPGRGRPEETRRREPQPEFLPETEEETRFGLDDLSVPESMTLVPAEPVTEEREPDVSAETPESAPAAELAEAEETARPKRGGRRRSRGGSRRRRQEPAAESTSSEAEPEKQEESSESEPPAPRERTRFMDSTERRTDEGDEGHEPLEPSASTTSKIRDEDLFFPRSEPVSAAAPPPRKEPEAYEPEPYTPPEEAPPRPLAEPTSSYSTEPEAHQDSEEEFDPFRPEPERMESPAEPAVDEPFAEFDDPFAELEEGGDEGFQRRPRQREGREGRRGDRRRQGRRPMGRPGSGRPKPLIQDIFRRGQEVLVQVIKEGIGTKGPTLSTYISIAGRYLVLMPGLNRVGVSRKIADDEQRRRLREIFNELKPPKGLGFIIRTAGMDRNKKELQGDLAYLSRLWEVVVRRIRKLKAPAEIYQESDMITRTIRDTFTSDIDTIWVDEPNAYEHAKEFLTIVMPRYANRIKLYEDPEPLFHKYGIEDEIARIQRRHVPLPHGGSIVIDQTEALVAIDVNSGNFRADNNAEETAYQMNLQAAKEIARQLRLRDLGGVIVNDFIDMRDEKHRRGVERALREAVKRDRARTKILKISAFGLIEMTRQRIRPSLKRSVYQDCPHCGSTGQVKTCESMSIDVMRMLQLAAHRNGVQRIQIRVAEDVANYLLNKKRKEITRLEESGGIQIGITGIRCGPPETLEFECYDNHNNEVKFLPYEETHSSRR
jgi:ribonuclease E